MVDILDTLEKVLLKELNGWQDSLKQELKAQGHVLTGQLLNSIRFELTREGSKIVGVFFAADYGLIVNFGVKAANIPYGGGKTGAKTSKYIQGLFSFFRRKGLSERESLSAAFATAKTHKREGMPSRGSFKYSENGRRTGWIKEALKKKVSALPAIIAAFVALEVKINILSDIEFD